MGCLNDLSGCELVTLASIVAVTISKGLTAGEINTLGNFFTAIGTNLTTIAGQM